MAKLVRHRRIPLARPATVGAVKEAVGALKALPGVDQITLRPGSAEVLIAYDLRCVRLEEVESCLEAHALLPEHSHYRRHLTAAIHRSERAEQELVQADPHWDGCCSDSQAVTFERWAGPGRRLVSDLAGVRGN